MEMAKHVRTTIRYDGPALAGHEMDVQDLAPALMALAELIQIANRKFNGQRVAMRVLVNADVEQKCFMLDISLVQTLMEQARTLFAQPDIATAKEIAEWLGIISGGSAGLFAVVKKLMSIGKDSTPLSIEQQGENVAVVVTGSAESVVINRHTYILAQDPSVIEQVKRITKPLLKKGYEDLSFLENGEPIVEFDKEDAQTIADMPSSPLDPLPTESVSTIEGAVRIKSAQYEGGAKWSFLWNGRAIDAEMVGPASEWVSSFQSNAIDAPPNTILKVKMTETVRLDNSGQAVGKATYQITEVFSTSPPGSQLGLDV